VVVGAEGVEAGGGANEGNDNGPAGAAGFAPEPGVNVVEPKEKLVGTVGGFGGAVAVTAIGVLKLVVAALVSFGRVFSIPARWVLYWVKI